MKRYDYYENQLEDGSEEKTPMPDTPPINICLRDTHSESYRFNDADDVCDDGRSGV